MKKALLLIILFVILRSFYTPGFKFFTKSVHPFSLTLYSIIICTLVFLILLKGKIKKFLKIKNKKEFFLVGFISLIGGILLDLSIFYLPVKSFALLISFLPIFVAIFSSIYIKEKPSKMIWFATFITVIGSLTFKQVWKGFVFGLGDLFIFIGTVLYSIGIVRDRKFVKKTGRKELILVSSLFSLPFVFILAMSTGNLQLIPTIEMSLLYIAFVVFISISTIYLAAWIIREAPAYIFSTATTALVPIGAIILGIFMHGETLSFFEIIGGAIMVSGALLTSLKKK